MGIGLGAHNYSLYSRLKDSIKFTTPQQYINYDFDDSHCFFCREVLEYIESVEKIDPAPFIDCPQKIADVIKELFKNYDALIINEDDQKLYGEIDDKMFLVKKSLPPER